MPSTAASRSSTPKPGPPRRTKKATQARRPLPSRLSLFLAHDLFGALFRIMRYPPAAFAAGGVSQRDLPAVWPGLPVQNFFSPCLIEFQHLGDRLMKAHLTGLTAVALLLAVAS